MSHRLQIIAALALLTVTAIGTIGIATQIETTYFLPPGGSGVALRKTAVFAPAALGTVAAAVASLALVGHLIFTVRGQSRRWMWAVASLLAVLIACAPFLIAGMDHPTF